MSDDRCALLCLDLPHAERVRASIPAPAAAEASAFRARALADPTRLRVAWALAEGGELCVCDLAWVTGLAQNLVSHHLRRLRIAGLAGSRREGRLVVYHLTGAGHQLLAALTDPAMPQDARQTGEDGAAIPPSSGPVSSTREVAPAAKNTPALRAPRASHPFGRAGR